MKKIFTRDYFNGKKREQGKRNKEYVESIRSLGCQNCPEKSLCCIDFHHRDPKTKKFKITNMIYCGYSLRAIKNEMKKCDRLCKNCHILFPSL